ncbi:unnamed protein product [Amoebophrya sp. A25]|nr:unnamed protein product [Amoebophrya sp. A25]|eukprot:GSA25T00001008001.1
MGLVSSTVRSIVGAPSAHDGQQASAVPTDAQQNSAPDVHDFSDTIDAADSLIVLHSDPDEQEEPQQLDHDEKNGRRRSSTTSPTAKLSQRSRPKKFQRQSAISTRTSGAKEDNKGWISLSRKVGLLQEQEHTSDTTGSQVEQSVTNTAAGYGAKKAVKSSSSTTNSSEADAMITSKLEELKSEKVSAALNHTSSATKEVPGRVACSSVDVGQKSPVPVATATSAFRSSTERPALLVSTTPLKAAKRPSSSINAATLDVDVANKNNEADHVFVDPTEAVSPLPTKCRRKISAPRYFQSPRP